MNFIKTVAYILLDKVRGFTPHTVKDSIEWEETYMTILERGKEIGKEIGSEECLIRQVWSKYNKGLSIATIAEHLEVTEKEVEEIIQIIKQYPKATAEEITDIYREIEKS
jgi:uncharacterized protein (DUF433 family)